MHVSPPLSLYLSSCLYLYVELLDQVCFILYLWMALWTSVSYLPLNVISYLIIFFKSYIINCSQTFIIFILNWRYLTYFWLNYGMGQVCEVLIWQKYSIYICISLKILAIQRVFLRLIGTTDVLILVISGGLCYTNLKVTAGKS